MSRDSLVFEQGEDSALVVRDGFSNQQYRIESAGPIEIEQTTYDDFPGPVTDALVIDAVNCYFPVFYASTIRDESGDMEAHLDINSESYAGDGTTFIEFHTPVKSYLRIDGPFEYSSTRDEVSIDLSETRRVILGSRTKRCYPSETITVSNSIPDLTKAISHFGDTILTASPERSFSTLRGHPPRLRVGEALDIPDSLSEPDEGVTITVPPTKSALLSVAPLAYYLLATVETGSEFRLETETGFTHQSTEESVPDAVRSVLTRCFYLDCLVRTEGLYPVDLQERHDFEELSEISLNFEELYEQSLAERIETYLQVDPAVIEAVTGEWPVTAIVEPNSTGIESLPYLVYELAHIRPENPPRYTGNEARRHALTAFSQGIHSTRSTSLVFESNAEFVDVPQTESQQTIWVGDGIPLSAAKFLLEGYENDISHVDEAPTADSEDSSLSGLEVTVICNEKDMSQEPAHISSVLDPRDDFPMDISTYSQLSTSDLKRVLETGTDYLHFVGHATPDGLECPDGLLDVGTIEESNVTTFFLNACQSYQQGKQLVQKGSSGGIVTYSDISDKYALEASGLIGRLLNEGFPIGACLSIVRDTTPIGGQYTVVGTHSARLIQADGGQPNVGHIFETENGYKIELIVYGAGQKGYGVGSLIRYALDPTDRHYLVPSSTTIEFDWDELTEFLSLDSTPVVYEGSLQTKAEFFDAVED